MTKLTKRISSFLILLALVWLFFPRLSTRWNIKEDEVLLKGKEDYLKDLSASAQPSKRPNILIILADDLSPKDLAFLDPVHGIETPRLEELARSGVTFTDASASSPICSPSRAGMLTGRIQNRSGFDSQPMQIYPFFPLYYYAAEFFLDTDEMVQVKYSSYPFYSQLKKQGVPQSELMLQEILGAGGYETALIGKWHLGYGEEQHPLNRGFDRYYGFLEAFSYFDDPDKEDVVSFQHDLFWEKHIWSKERKGPSAIEDQGEIIEEDRHLTDAIAGESLEFLRRHAASGTDDPFFLYSSFSAPHTPFQELREYYDRFPYVEDENKRIYYAMISHLDDAVGQIIDELDRLGLRENTLVFFASDNGGASYTEATENGILAGGKMSQFQGGLEVPFLMSWPGVVPREMSFDHPVTLMDIFSTTLAAAGYELPADRIIDGVDLIPYAADLQSGEPHRSLFWKSDFNLTLRRGPWKLMVNRKSGEYQLYHLEEDRGEYRDLSDSYPDLVEELLREIQDYDEQCKPPLWPRVMDFEIEVHGKTYRFAT